MDYKNFKLDAFEFYDDWLSHQKWHIRYKDYIDDLLIPRPSFGFSPIILKSKNKNLLKNRFVSFCEVTDLDNLVDSSIIDFHQNQIERFYTFRKIIYLSFSAVIAPILGSGILWLINVSAALPLANLTENIYISNLLNIFLNIFILMIGLLFISILANLMHRAADAIVRNRFADTFCVLNVLYLIIELSREDVLFHPQKKKALQLRLNELINNTRALQYRFVSNSKLNQQWANEHFSRLQLYIGEREKWVVSPIETTLGDLRGDFYNLAKLFVSGRYGDFDWSLVSAPPVASEKIFSFHTVAIFLPKLFVVILPLAGLGFLMFHPEYLPAGIGINFISLIFVAWLLLTLDATLKLGIVAGVVNLAKEIKGLN